MARRREAGLVALIVAACGTGIWTATHDGYFTADDWLNLALAREHGMSLDYLKLSYFGHFAPVHRVLDWVWALKLPANWGAYLAAMLAVFAITVVATYVLLRVLGCGVTLAAAATALLASSPVWVRLIQWPASAQHVAIGLAATAVSLAAAMLWFERRSGWLLVLAGGAMATGVLAYEKPVLIVMYVVLLRYFVLADSLQPRALIARARGDWPLLATLIAVAGVYAAVVVVGEYSNTSEWPGVGALAEFYVHSWARGTGALVVGQGSPGYAAPIPVALIVLAQVVFVALIALSVYLRRSAWRAWLFFVICWLLTLGPIGISRVVDYGTWIGQDPRYYAEIALLLPLAIALAFRRTGEATRSLPALRVPRPAALAIAGGVVALLGLSLASSYRRTADAWQGSTARQWVERLQTSAEAVRGPDGRISMIDGSAPPYVTGSNPEPYNTLSTVLPVALDAPLDFEGGGERPAVVDPDGTLRPATLRRRWFDPLEQPHCGPSVLRRRVRGVHVEAHGLVRAIGTRAARPALISVLADNGAGYVVAPKAARVDPRQRVAGTVIDLRGLRALELRVPRGVCIEAVVLATAT